MNELLGTLGDVLPAAIAVALSPIPIIAIVLMLATPRGRSNGVAFALGWVLGLVVVSTVVVLLASGQSQSTTDSISWAKVVLGVLLLGLALRRWRNRPAPGEEEPLPGWVAQLDEFTPPRSLVLGVGLSAVNPKNLALTAAAAASIAQADLGGPATVVDLALFVVIGSLTVVGPVVMALVAPARSEHVLSSLRAFMAQHGGAIMMVVLAVLGAKLLGDGLGVLG